MKIYAICDEESDLYVTRGNVSRLGELGVNTRFFSNRSDAMRFVENKLNEDLNSSITHLQNDLAWDLLETILEKDRWHINCSIDEYRDAVNQFKHLKVVELCLKEDRR